MASYNDPLLFFTINEIITKARNPGNIIVAVIDQNYHDQRSKINKLEYSKQIRYMYVNLIDTLGVSWARNLAFSLYDDETYFLQIDAHTAFDSDWDIELINQHTELLELSKKPIISSFPNDFDIINGEPVCKRDLSRSVAIVTRPIPEQKLKINNPILLISGQLVRSKTSKLACHIAGGFVFCSGKYIEELPYDPYMYFSGEEQSIAARAYTHGWDIYHTVYTPIYHKYKVNSAKYSSQHWYGDFKDNRSITYERLLSRSRKRLTRLLYGDGMPDSVYGLGKVRTLEDFASMCGINYKKRTITGVFIGDHMGL